MTQAVPQKPCVLCILGPTASGKTHLALELFEQGIAEYPIQIISVDSVMVYRGFDIGTGKPESDILKKIPHELINICEPNPDLSTVYSVGRFCEDARAAIQRAIQAGKIPVLVGGTMLYFKALQFGLAALPRVNPEVRLEILERANQVGWLALHAELSRIDPVAAAQIQPQDQQRIQRGLEVYLGTGRILSDYWHAENSFGIIEHYDYTNVMIMPDRKILHGRIEQRFLNMLTNGLIEEVEQLRVRYPFLTALHPAYRSVGYRQILSYLQGEISKPQMIEQAIIATRQLAKRQYTWLKSWGIKNKLTDLGPVLSSELNSESNSELNLDIDSGARFAFNKNNFILNSPDLKTVLGLLHASGFLDKVRAYMY